MSFVVTSVPFGVVIVDVFSSMDGILAAEYHDEGTNNCYAGDDQVDFNSEMIAGPFHRISPILKNRQVNNPPISANLIRVHLRNEVRDVGGLLELATPYQKLLFEGTDFVANLTCRVRNKR